jgi:hypothetical protein
MAQVPEVATEHRALVLDANILLRGGLRAFSSIGSSAGSSPGIGSP